MNFSTISFLSLLSLSILSTTVTGQKPGGSEPKPNIIFILADDIGYGDIKALNTNSKIATPQLDRLASEGISFLDAHSNSAVCTPTRYGILTGRYCYRSELKQGVLFGYSPALIEEGRTTLASFLDKQGYQTACIGKWHLGLGWQKKEKDKPLFVQKENWVTEPSTNCDYTKPVTAGPNSVGFEYSYILPGSLDMAPYVYLENQKVTAPVTQQLAGVNTERGVFYREGEMAAGFDINNTLDHFTDKAVEYIGKAANQDRPFFLYFALTAPHTPWLPAEKYQGKSGAGRYGDFVMQVDDEVNRIVEATEKAGISDNTIIVFTSDNASDWRVTDIEEWKHHANYIYAGRKSDAWDGGHHIPFIVKWPARIKPGSQSKEVICTTDWMATCANILNVSLGNNEGEDSYSFLPALLGKEKKNTDRAPVIHHSIQGKFAIRKGDWKYIDCRGSGGWTSPGEETDPLGQLYNMKADPEEQHNLYLKNPKKVEELKKELGKYETTSSVQLKTR